MVIAATKASGVRVMAECICLARAGRRSHGRIFTGTWDGSQTCSREEGERVKNRPGEAGDVTHGEEVTAREDPSACK